MSSRSSSAWNSGLFPLLTLPVFIGLLMALEILLSSFAPETKLPPVPGFRWPQIHLLLGVWAALMMLSFATGKIGAGQLTATKGPGLWLMLVGALGLAVGAIVQLQTHARTD